MTDAKTDAKSDGSALKLKEEKELKVEAKGVTELHRAVFENDAKLLLEVLEIKTADVNQQDHFGNSPLMLAVMLGRAEMVDALLAAGALIKVKNTAGWGPLSEAISYGNRDILRKIWTVFRSRSTSEMKERFPQVVASIEKLGDFSLAIQWSFKSWLPLVSRLLPGDTYRIWKRGTTVRIDSTLVSFEGLNWTRGDISYVMVVDAAGQQQVTVLDNQAKTYVHVRPSTSSSGDGKEDDSGSLSKESQELIELDLDDFLSQPISAVSSPGKVEFTRAKAGIWGFRHDKTEKIGGQEARVFDVKNINLCTKKRMEHLSEAEVKELARLSEVMKDPKAMEAKIKADHEEAERQTQLRKQRKLKLEERRKAREAAAKQQQRSGESKGEAKSESKADGEGKSDSASSTRTAGGDAGAAAASGAESESDSATAPVFHSADDGDSADSLEGEDEDDEGKQIVHRPSLPAPEPVKCTWEEYSRGDAAALQGQLGRRVECKEDNKALHGSVAMADGFPLSLPAIVAILELAAPNHKHIVTLREFISNSLPEGFPVKLELPVFPTVTGTVLFTQFDGSAVPASKFEVPADYTLDPELVERF